MARKNPIFKKKSLIKFPKFSFKKSPIKFKKKNSKLAKILKFSLWSILAIVVFLTVAAVVGGESFDIRNYAKGNDDKEKVSCPSGCQGNYEWYYNRSEDKCKKRYSKTCAGTSTNKSGNSNQKQDQQDSNNISCSGQCITGIKSCTEKGMANSEGSCFKGICCGGSSSKPADDNSDNEADGSTGAGKVDQDLPEDPPKPAEKPVASCTTKGHCIDKNGEPCCANSRPIYDESCSDLYFTRCK